MTRRPVSLGARLLLGAAVLTLAAMVVAGAVTGFALRHFIQGQVDGRLDGQILAVADALRQDTNGQFRLERIVDGPPFDRPLSGWYWEVLAPRPCCGPVRWRPTPWTSVRSTSRRPGKAPTGARGP